MGDYYRKTCDNTIKLKYKTKHLNTKSHKTSSMGIINGYCVKNPELKEIENILYKHVIEYNNKFEFYEVDCKWNYSLKIPSFALNLKECLIDRVVKD